MVSLTLQVLLKLRRTFEVGSSYSLPTLIRIIKATIFYTGQSLSLSMLGALQHTRGSLMAPGNCHASVPQFGGGLPKSTIIVAGPSQITRIWMHSTLAPRSRPCVSLLDSTSPRSFTCSQHGTTWSQPYCKSNINPTDSKTLMERVQQKAPHLEKCKPTVDGDRPSAANAIRAYISTKATIRHSVLLMEMGVEG